MPPKDGPILELSGIEKRFPGTHALKGMDLAFDEGEIHAIAGENGAGKSTLIKILTGAHEPTAGSLRWRGAPVRFRTPGDALALGIDAVHQEVVACPHLNVAANLFLGAEWTRGGLLAKRAMAAEAQAVLDGLGFAIRADAILGRLTIGQQQLVATARAAHRGTRFLIFDEPTGYLTRQETEQLFRLIRRLHADGVTVVYISHRLEEIFELADRVSILRDGRLISTRRTADTNERELIRDMVARPLDDVHYKRPVAAGELLLETQALTGPGFADVSVEVRRGEIVGLYGLIGAGRSEFVTAVFGRHRPTGGMVRWRGEAVAIRREADAIQLGMALVPESRRDQGLCLNLPVGFNLALPSYEELGRSGLVDRRAERGLAERLMARLKIVAAGRGAPALTLSGGNQQKIVVGKWLERGAQLFIFDEPTVGVDVGTKSELYRVFADLLEAGAGIILISSYLPEVYDLSDRLLVFRRGRHVASHGWKEVDMETILTEAIGA
ncbi:ABC transporter ATP-binding protein [Aliidongia dinghuensis]|uniref:ABC transporter ATP-binding protein n=1 Tax=Aliidongia dinghuensis TaxID=1867774 RepID=A0A8J3E3F1_9PROT|nr:sugar ABC transporter ATP-binding protein [Aliidongia dinghuensis]GGF18399.1 ABC transporter ATP-binding protein [Aliidongia dinghuensis]